MRHTRCPLVTGFQTFALPIYRLRSGDPLALGDLLLGMQCTLPLSVTFTSNTKFPADLPPPRVYSILDRMLVLALGERLTQPYLIDTQRDDGNIAIYVQLTDRSEEHTSELQSLMRISYAVFCLKKKKSLSHTTYRKQQTHTY